jgi:hypothetical protein
MTSSQAALHIVSTAWQERQSFCFQAYIHAHSTVGMCCYVHNPIPQIPHLWSFSRHILSQIPQGVNAVILVYSLCCEQLSSVTADNQSAARHISMNCNDALPLRLGLGAAVTLINPSLSGTSWQVLT